MRHCLISEQYLKFPSPAAPIPGFMALTYAVGWSEVIMHCTAAHQLQVSGLRSQPPADSVC